VQHDGCVRPPSHVDDLFLRAKRWLSRPGRAGRSGDQRAHSDLSRPRRGLPPSIIGGALSFAVGLWACDEGPLVIATRGDGAGGVSATGGRMQTGGAALTGGSTGGRLSTGGTVATGGAAGCGTKACGGNVVGRWTVASSCMRVAGSVDLAYFGLQCPAPQASGSLNIEGNWTAAANGTYTDETVTWGSFNLVVPPPCVKRSGSDLSCSALGRLLMELFPSVSCAERGDGGCDCMVAVKHTGSVGTGRTPVAGVTGKYVARGATIVVDNMTTYDVCAPTETPTLTLAPHDPLVSGFVSLRPRSD